MGELLNDLLRYVDQMGRGEWLLVVAVGLAIGLVCMRGLGSRSSY